MGGRQSITRGFVTMPKNYIHINSIYISFPRTLSHSPNIIPKKARKNVLTCPGRGNRIGEHVASFKVHEARATDYPNIGK